MRQINGDQSLSENTEVIKVGIPQLDIVLFGTIWEGQRRTVDVWEDFEGDYSTNEKFTFNLELNTAESIVFSEKQPNIINHSYISRFKYSLGRMNDLNSSLINKDSM